MTVIACVFLVCLVWSWFIYCDTLWYRTTISLRQICGRSICFGHFDSVFSLHVYSLYANYKNTMDRTRNIPWPCRYIILYDTIQYYTILYFAWIKYLLVCLLACAYFECIVVSLDEIFCIDLLDHNFGMEARVGSIALSAINLLRFAPSLCSRRENVCRSPVICWTTDCFRDLARQTPWSFTKSYQLEQTFLTHPCPPKRR